MGQGRGEGVRIKQSTLAIHGGGEGDGKTKNTPATESSPTVSLWEPGKPDRTQQTIEGLQRGQGPEELRKER